METLIASIDWFLEYCAHHRKLSPHTLKAYRHDLTHFHAFASNPVKDVQMAKVDREGGTARTGTHVVLQHESRVAGGD